MGCISHEYHKQELLIWGQLIRARDYIFLERDPSWLMVLQEVLFSYLAKKHISICTTWLEIPSLSLFKLVVQLCYPLEILVILSSARQLCNPLTRHLFQFCNWYIRKVIRVPYSIWIKKYLPWTYVGNIFFRPVKYFSWTKVTYSHLIGLGIN